jgi:hypothetical protein
MLGLVDNEHIYIDTKAADLIPARGRSVACNFRNRSWLGLKLNISLGLSTKPSIQVQPSQVQKTSFNFTLHKIFIKVMLQKIKPHQLFCPTSRIHIRDMKLQSMKTRLSTRHPKIGITNFGGILQGNVFGRKTFKILHFVRCVKEYDILFFSWNSDRCGEFPLTNR